MRAIHAQSLWASALQLPKTRCMLNTVFYDAPQGAADRRPLLIAHGLFGSARNWNVIAKRLSATRPVITVDMRNHGASPWFDTNSYLDMAADLAQVLRGPTDVLGHSMGGKAAMVLALTRPELVGKLIVADIAPVDYQTIDLSPLEAMKSVDLSQVTRRADAGAQMHGLDAGLVSFLLQSLDLKNKRWVLNLDVLEAEMGAIRGWPDVQGRFDGSTLFLSGGASDYVQHSHRAAIKALFPNARFAKIPDAGHWLHAEKPREFEASVEAFLEM